MEKEFPYELEEQITHTEYVGEERKSGHIPKAELELKDGLPVALKCAEQNFAVETTVVKKGAREFFSHTVKRSREGDPLEVTFANPQAKAYFEVLTRNYRNQVLSKMQEGLQTELELEHSPGPGKYQSTLQAGLDKVQVLRVEKEVRQGREPGPVNELGALVADLTEALQERFDDFQFKYLDDALPLQPRKGIEPLTVRFPANDPLGNYSAEVLEWLDQIQEKDIPVKKQTTRVDFPKPLTITKLSIGEVVASPAQEFIEEERIAEKVLFATQTLHFRPRQQITVFEANYFSPADSNPDESLVVSKPNAFVGRGGSYHARKIFLNQPAAKVIDDLSLPDEDGKIESSVHLEIPFTRKVRTIDHESGHFVDVFGSEATKPQSEGFADAIQYGFEFKKSLASLRIYSEYSKIIDKERVLEILSSKPPDGLTAKEVYQVPATFFCWMYEKTGPEDFVQFYGLLTGGAFESREEGAKKLEHDLTTRDSKKYYQGNVTACLEALPKDEHFPWKDADELLDEYVKAVNP